jgi:hypothetical protein
MQLEGVLALFATEGILSILLAATRRTADIVVFVADLFEASIAEHLPPLLYNVSAVQYFERHN